MGGLLDILEGITEECMKEAGFTTDVAMEPVFSGE
jgi:hypothetical protein